MKATIEVTGRNRDDIKHLLHLDQKIADLPDGDAGALTRACEGAYDSLRVDSNDLHDKTVKITVEFDAGKSVTVTAKAK